MYVVKIEISNVADFLNSCFFTSSVVKFVFLDMIFTLIGVQKSCLFYITWQVALQKRARLFGQKKSISSAGLRCATCTDTVHDRTLYGSYLHHTNTIP